MARPSAFRSFFRGLTAPVAALALVGVLALSGALASLDRLWFDSLQRALASRAPLPPDTAFVLIDEQSLSEMGGEQYSLRWPWRRAAFAAVFAGLHRAGAKAIVADFIFFETSDEDAVLGAFAAGLPEVTLGAMPGQNGESDRLPVVWPKEFRAQHAALFSARQRWGFVRSQPDSDTVLRRYMRGGSLTESALGLPSAGDRPQPTLLRWRGNLKELVNRDVPSVPAAWFAKAGWEMVNHAMEKAPDLDPVALARAIDEEPVPQGEAFEKVRGRTVFVGAYAAAAFDSIATPVGTPQPGVIVHWTAMANLVAGGFLYDAGPTTSALALLVVVGLIGLTGHGGLGMRKPALAALALGAGALGGSAVAFNFNLWFAPASSIVGAAAAFGAVAVESFRLERARKREIQGWFGTYVSPAVVKRLVQNPDSLKLGGERKELTVYFADLAGFTTISEKLPADQLVAMVNTFLESLTEGVLNHGCYLDKYIGDAIMAVFGSPEALENHALAACLAALDSQERLAALNDRIEREHGIRLGMRIGINTGDMIVGNVGSERKRNYTVLGDAVNLASRLEGASKEFGTSILIGPRTAEMLGGKIVTRPVAHLRVKGKLHAVAVHELIGEPKLLDEATKQFVARYSEGFAAFCEQRFDEAISALDAALVLRPGDFLTTRYLDEARILAVTPPPPEWEPVLKLETK